MIHLNIHEAKTHLSRALERVARGETVILCRRNVPIAEIRPLPVRRSEPRPIGPGISGFAVPSSFFEPLPDDALASFDGA